MNDDRQVEFNEIVYNVPKHDMPECATCRDMINADSIPRFYYGPSVYCPPHLKQELDRELEETRQNDREGGNQ